MGDTGKGKDTDLDNRQFQMARLSMVSLGCQLNLKTSAECVDIYSSIYYGVSKLDEMGLMDPLETFDSRNKNNRIKSRIKKRSNKKKKVVSQLGLMKILNGVSLMQLCGLMITKGINIKLMTKKSNTAVNLFDLLFARHSGISNTGDAAIKDYQLLKRIESRPPFLIYQDFIIEDLINPSFHFLKQNMRSNMLVITMDNIRKGKGEKKQVSKDRLSMKSLSCQLKLKTFDELQDIYNSIYCGVSRLEAIGLIEALELLFKTDSKNSTTKKMAKTNKNKSRSSKKDREEEIEKVVKVEKVVIDLELENIENHVALIHLFGLMIFKGINITLMSVDNKRKNLNVFNLLSQRWNDINVDDAGRQRKYPLLKQLGSQAPILVYYDDDLLYHSKNVDFDRIFLLNNERLVKYSTRWTIDDRIKLIKELYDCLMDNVLIKEYENGQTRDSVDDVINALCQTKLGNFNVLYDDDYQRLRYDFNCYSEEMYKKTYFQFSSFMNDDIDCDESKESGHNDIYKILANASMAVKSSNRNYFPRNCQIAAVLLYYRRRAHLKGRLLQVGTGEGKSIIVYLIASVEVLLNKKQVDVVTSQELLAKAGFEDHYDLYHSLGIEVGYLDPEESGDYPRRRWQYSNWNVVYGTASQFMGDMLQIEENLRENRKCQVCIIDEVDNSFIDTVRTSTLLTTPTAGTREFNLIFMMIWVQLKQAIQGMGHPIVMDDGLYFMMKNAALINVLWDYLKDLSLFSFTSEADETNKTNKIDTIISFLLFKIEKSNLLKDKTFRVKYGFDAIMKQYEYEYENDNQKDEEQGYVTLVRQVEMQLRNLIVDPRNVYKFLSLLSNKYILNCKISLYDLYNESRVVFKAYFENGDQFNESKNTFGCDFVLVNDKNVNNGVIKVLHYDKNRQMETTTKRQIYKMVLKKIGVSSNSNVNGMDHADDDEYIDNISCISSEKFELIPQFFKEYAKEKCYAWVCNAWKALLELDLSVDYVIKDGKIKVIEKSTGTVYPNMHWVDGLHQFLQLKHDLKMENMNFSSLIMTKAYFFMRYTENGGVITGLTGTLGGNAERNFYQNIFAKPLVRHNDLVCSNTQEWLNVIGLSCYSNLLSKKCVLIICSDIRSSEMIFNMIENGEQFIKYKKHLNRIFKYTRDDNTSNTGNNNNINCNSWIKNEITCGDVIVATNLAGRGTDIKLDKQVTKYGGLHVIVAFEPENGRILKQNIGRTCRSGHPGSAIIIINAQTCDYYYGTENIKAIKTYRQQCADHTMSNLEYNLNCDLKREEYFTRFVELMQELDEKYWHKVSQGVMQHGDCGFGNNCCTSHPPSKRIFSPAIKKQAHYKWSLLYPKIECWTDRQRNKSEVLWQEFETQVRHDLDKYKHKICYNPFYLNNAAFVGDIFNGLDIHQRKEMVDIVCDKGDYVGNHGISYFIKACIIMQENRYSLAKQAREEASQYLAKANEYFDLLKNRCDAWYALYTTVKMVNGGEYKDKTDFDRMIRMERCIFWEIVQESCNDCLKHINDREIEISFIPVREYFASQKLKFKSEFNLNIEVDDCIVSNYMECGLMYLMVIESTRKKRIYKNNTIETASRRVNRWKRIYFTAMGQMLHICQVIGGVILVTFSGGVVSFLGKHCIERAVDKIVGEIEKLFGDGFNFSQLWKRDLMIELIGLIAISVKAWNGPKLKEMVPTNVRQALDMEDISDSDCLNGIMAKQVAVDETGLDMFSVYNSIKNGSMKKDNIIITNSGVIKHLRKFDFELEKDAKFNFYGNSTSKSSNFSAVNAISNKEYIRGSYDCGMSGVMKCTKYSSIINDAIKNPILKNGIRLVSNVFSDFCTHMNNPDKTGFISCYIKCMVESHTGSCGITFVDICQDVQKLIMQFDAMDRICIGDGNGINDCENSDSIMQFTSILSNVMCLIEELGRLNKQESNKMKGKQDEKENIDRTTMRQIIDRIHNIGEIAAYCTRSSNVNPFEYILCLVHNAMYLVYKKGKPSRSELLRLGCDMYGSSKLKPIDKMARYMTKIERKCASKSITCQDFLSVIGKSINIVFERKTTIFKDTKNLLDILMDAYGIYSNKRYYISFDNNAFKICDSVFNMIFNSINRNESMAVDWKSQFKCIGKIITMLNYYTMNARENQLEVIKYVLEKLEKFFIIDNKIFETNENTSNNGYIYKKQLINFYNICKRITAMIERSININQGFRVNELHRELAEIGGMFSSEHETTVNEYFKHLQSIIHPSTTVQPACQVGRVLVRDSIRRHLRARAPPVYTTSYTAIAQIMITKVNPIANEVDNDSNRRDNSYPNSKKMHTVQDVLKCIVQCQNSFIYNTFSFVELFDIVYAFRNLCKNETNEKNEEIIIFDRISELHAKIITEMISIRQDITKNRGIISIVDVLKLMDMLVNIHSNAQGIESVEYGKHIIECSEYMSQLCSNFTKDLNESKVENENEYYDDNECTLRNYLSIPLQFVTSELFKNMAKGAFGNEMTSNLVINIISNVLNHFINIDENPRISSLIEFIKFVEKTMKDNINVDDTQDASIEKSNGHVELFIDNCSFSENINFGIEREIDFLINCFDNIRYTNIIGDSTLNEIGKWYQQARNRDPSVKKKEMSRYIKSLTTRWVEKCIHKFMKSLQDFYQKRI